MAEPDPDLWPRTLQRLASHEALSADAAAEVMRAIMSGDVTPAQVGGFLMALRTKGETVDELDGLARTALEFAHPVSPARSRPRYLRHRRRSERHVQHLHRSPRSWWPGPGVPVAKHGNRAASGLCGSADLLEALGVEDRPRCGGRRAVSGGGGDRVHVRSGLPSRVGPCGAGPPGAARAHLVQLPRSPHEPRPPGGPGGRRLRRADAPADGRGARSPRHPREALPRRGRPRRAHDDGPFAGPRRPRRRGPRDRLDPTAHGIARASKEDLRGGDAAESARIARAVLGGEQGPARDVVLLNAGAALEVAGVAPDLDGGDRHGGIVDRRREGGVDARPVGRGVRRCTRSRPPIASRP